jgi:hypothetical protein
MQRLAHYLLRVKAQRQTLWMMRRYRVWYIDNPYSGTLDRWWRRG